MYASARARDRITSERCPSVVGSLSPESLGHGEKREKEEKAGFAIFREYRDSGSERLFLIVIRVRRGLLRRSRRMLFSAGRVNFATRKWLVRDVLNVNDKRITV